MWPPNRLGGLRVPVGREIVEVDGTGTARAGQRFAPLVSGLEQADSICVDAHKWLNVPYDSAAILTRHIRLQAETFSSAATYLGEAGEDPDAVHLTPQNSRRFRALPLWMTLQAYGRGGYRELFEHSCDRAADLGHRIEIGAGFRLLAPVRVNVVCFTLDGPNASAAEVDDFLGRLNATGEVLMTGTQLDGVPGIRAAFTNWRTRTTDVERAWQAMQRCRVLISPKRA